MNGDNFQQLIMDPLEAAPFCRRAIALLQAQVRRSAFTALADWLAHGVGAPQPGAAIGALEQPDIGGCNGLLLALAAMKHDIDTTGTAEQRAALNAAATLLTVLRLFGQAADESLIQAAGPLADFVHQKLNTDSTLQTVVGMAATMEGRLNAIQTENNTEWMRAATAIRPLIQWLATRDVFAAPPPPAGPNPWLLVEGHTVFTYAGRRPDFSAIYTSVDGASRHRTAEESHMKQAYASLLGAGTEAESVLEKALLHFSGEANYAFILGDFLIGPPVGEGGFATVHAGRQISTGRKVAVKILHDGGSIDQVARFQKEAAYLALFSHPNIVSVYGYGQEQWLPAGASTGAAESWVDRFSQSAPVKTFIALEWIAGRTLDAVYRQGRTDAAQRPVATVVAQWFAQAAGAMAAVHTLGLIHRDIKPGNLMLTDTGVIKLMDFGIARPEDPNRSIVTTQGKVFGTLAYMSPEHVRAFNADASLGPASDIYSLCATFYELFTLERILHHDTQSAAMIQTLKLQGQRPQRPRQIARTLPWEIETILMGGLENDARDRYRSASDLQEDIQRFLRDEPIRYRRPSLGRRMVLGYRRNRAIANIAALCFCLALTGGIIWWRLPGTLHLKISPAGAVVRIGGRSFTTGIAALRLRLTNGVYPLTVTKPHYQPRKTTIVLGRLADKQISFALRHDQGTLNATSAPAGTEILLDGESYGSRIVHLPVNTGVHVLTAWAPDRFTAHRKILLGKGQTLHTRFDLERSVSWKYKSAAVQTGLAVITRPGSRRPLLLAENELDRIVFLSPVDGRVVTAFANPDGNTRGFIELATGGKAGRLIVTGGDGEAHTDGGDQVMAISANDSDPRAIWRWHGPAARLQIPGELAIAALPAANNHAAGQVVVAGCDGHIYLLNAANGKLFRDILISTTPLAGTPEIQTWGNGKAARLLLIYQPPAARDSIAHSSTFITECINPQTGRVEWHKTLTGFTHHMLVAAAGRHRPIAIAWSAKQWRILKGDTGTVISQGTLPGHSVSGVYPVATNGAAPTEIIFTFAPPTAPLLAIRISNGQTLWRSHFAVSPAQDTNSRGALYEDAAGHLLILGKQRLAAIAPLTGKVAWQIPGQPLGVMSDAGTGNRIRIVASMAKIGLVNLNGAGRRLWSVRLADAVIPRMLIASGHGGTRRNVLVSRSAAMIALLHGPRRLWRRHAVGPLQASPLRIALPGGTTAIVALGPWGQHQSLRVFNATDGRCRWAANAWFAPNRPPVIGRLLQGGPQAVIAIGQTTPGGRFNLLAYDCATGRPVGNLPTDVHSWLSCTPALADFTGQGRRDLAVSTWDHESIKLISTSTGKTVWRYRSGAPNFGAVAAAHLPGHSGWCVLAPSLDGYLYALRGTTGTLIWKAAIGGGGSRSMPILARLPGGHAVVLLTNRAGELVVVDATHGRIQWIGHGSLSIDQPWPAPERSHFIPGGRVVLATLGNRIIALAALGDSGLAAFDLASHKLLWQTGFNNPVIATPALVNMTTHGSPRQVLAATATGRILLLNLADGRLRYHLRISVKPIEAAPLVISRGSNKSPEIVVADDSFQLQAISTRGWLNPPVK